VVSARGSRGAALLLVLWLIALLTALVGGFALVARMEHLQGQVLVRGLVAQSAARAGVEYAMTRLASGDPERQWQPDGRPYPWRYGNAQLEIRIVDESGKLDINQADATVLAALLAALGSDPVDAERLAAAIVDWRDPDQLTQPAGGAEDNDYASAGRPYGAKDAAFEGIAELEQVLGFTPELYALVAPHVTVHSGLPRPEPTFASAPVLDAIGLDGAAVVEQRTSTLPGGGGAGGAGQAAFGAGGANPSGTYSIDSLARLADGRESLLRVVVRAGGSAVPGMAYTALHWEEGASPR
jgi:general secretion pathway protein K